MVSHVWENPVKFDFRFTQSTGYIELIMNPNYVYPTPFSVNLPIKNFLENHQVLLEMKHVGEHAHYIPIKSSLYLSSHQASWLGF
jgi:hypothetical protein